jgi:hypothetical protein
VVQLILTLLAVAVYLVAVVAILSYVPSSSFGHGTEDLQAILLLAGCAIAVIYQYARRKTLFSRLLLASLAIAIFLLAVATPYSYLAARNYPLLGDAQTPPMLITLLTPNKPDQTQDDNREKNIQIELPFAVSGIASESAVQVDGTILTINRPNGRDWNSGWQSVNSLLLPVSDHLDLWFKIKRKVFEEIKSENVLATISVAARTFRDKDAETVVASDSEFTVPRVGICRVERQFGGGIVCHYALSEQSTVLVETESSKNTCPAKVPPPQGKIAFRSGGNADAGPISPVGTLNFWLWNWEGVAQTQNSSAISICTGTPLRFSFPEFVKQMRLELQLQSLHIADYQYSPVRFGFASR